MTQRYLALVWLGVLLCAAPAWAQVSSGGSDDLVQADGSKTPQGGVGGAAKVAEQFDGGGEHSVEGVTWTEEHYSTIPIGGTDAMIAADQLYKSGPGYVRSITCYSDATATAGTIALRDNTAAGAGNILWSFDVLAVAYNTPFTVDLQTPFSVGLYLDFTTVADMKCMVRFR